MASSSREGPSIPPFSRKGLDGQHSIYFVGTPAERPQWRVPKRTSIRYPAQANRHGSLIGAGMASVLGGGGSSVTGGFLIAAGWGKRTGGAGLGCVGSWRSLLVPETTMQRLRGRASLFRRFNSRY